MVVDTGALIGALELLLQPNTLLWLTIGMIIGILLGAIPGIGSSPAMAITLPLTIYLPRHAALIYLISIYSGSLYAGSISAILVNVPGTAGAAATTFDGYPMTRSGKAREALAVSAVSSVFGALIGSITLLLLISSLTGIVLIFGAAEYFLIALLGLAMITIVVQGSLVKGLVSGLFGMLITTIGIAPMSADLRYTFGMLDLYDGLSFVVILIGVFAISEMMKLSTETGGISQETVEITGGVRKGVTSVLRQPLLIIKSSYIGMIIGSIPGAGASVANFVAYIEAVRSDKSSESFGEGNPKGVMASESANNGNCAGALVPTLAFGIPGSGATALLLGGLIMHGLTPGPAMFNEDLVITYSLILSIILGCVFILVVGLGLMTQFSYLTEIDTNWIIPTVSVLAVLGAYSFRINWIDILSVLVFGVIGYYMVKNDYSIIAFILGVVLGPIAETRLFQSLQISGGSPTIFVTRPLSALLVFLILVIIVSAIRMQRSESGT